MSLQDYDNAEEQAYREMQNTLKLVQADGSAGLFELPTELRGWFYACRSGLSMKGQAQLILSTSGSTKLEELRRVL